MNQNELTLRELVTNAILYMQDSNYSAVSIKTYRLIWNRLIEYGENCGQHQYSLSFGYEFLRNYYGIFGSPKSHFDRTKIRAIRILVDFFTTGIFPRKYSLRQCNALESFGEIFEIYQGYLRKRNLSENTVTTRLSRISTLFRYLESINTCDLSTISRSTILDFIEHLNRNYSSAGRSNILFTLRDFLSCPLLENHLQAELGRVITVIHTNKHERLPSFYSSEEVDGILSSVDRNSRQGKMDYLIILLAAQLGMRTSDIRCLQLEDLNWTNNSINLIRKKTNRFLQLPMTDSVKFALLDYLKNSRPMQADTGSLFVRIKAPHLPYSDNNRFTGRVSLYFKKACIQTAGKHHGLHSMRHSLASRLLNGSTPITSIANALGHESIETTKNYLWIDIEQLRSVALEVPINENL